MVAMEVPFWSRQVDAFQDVSGVRHRRGTEAPAARDRLLSEPALHGGA